MQSNSSRSAGHLFTQAESLFNEGKQSEALDLLSNLTCDAEQEQVRKQAGALFSSLQKKLPPKTPVAAPPPEEEQHENDAVQTSAKDRVIPKLTFKEQKALLLALEEKRRRRQQDMVVPVDATLPLNLAKFVSNFVTV